MVGCASEGAPDRPHSQSTVDRGLRQSLADRDGTGRGACKTLRKGVTIRSVLAISDRMAVMAAVA